ncbi:MAG TPA: FKBP-type peptidyl-prolyl cis-trans isomerase [Solirubrobacterales bacterium]|nr:FKBP-type peptidyl-prolyl cis-trans isomerase [Solirubrobacterales bacterium]
MKTLILTIFACAALAVAGCGSDDDDTTSDSTQAEGNAAQVEQAADTSGRTKPEVTVPDGEPPAQLEETELIEGTGKEAKSGDEVTVQYVGVGYESEEEFDSSWSRNEPFPFTLGAGEVIPGWDQGVAGMKVGGRRELVIPPELAYGETGSPPVIGPNETLIFVVDLVEVG